MSNFDNENITTFEAHLMSLKFKDKDKSKEKDSMIVIQPGKIEETKSNGPVQPNFQTEINVITADESMDIPQLSEEQVKTMQSNARKYRARVHYRPIITKTVDKKEDR